MLMLVFIALVVISFSVKIPTAILVISGVLGIIDSILFVRDFISEKKTIEERRKMHDK